MLPAWTQEPKRVAIVHDWLTGMRGGEAILDVICELFPRADLFTLLQTDFSMSESILNGRTIHTSYLQKLMRFQRGRNEYRKLLPLFPHAISTLDVSQYDLVISNTHCVAKGVKKRRVHCILPTYPHQCGMCGICLTTILVKARAALLQVL